MRPVESTGSALQVYCLVIKQAQGTKALLASQQNAFELCTKLPAMDGADTQNDEAVATFSAITGADAQTAEHTLEAFGWDLNRGVNFFLENGARMPLPSRPALDDDEPVLLGEEAAPSWRRGDDSGASEERAALACERSGAPLVVVRVGLCFVLSLCCCCKPFFCLVCALSKYR